MSSNFVKRPSLKRYIQSYIEDFVVDVHLFFVWIEEGPHLFVKLINCHPKSRRLVNKIISSPDIRWVVPLPKSTFQFSFLLNHKIAQLTKSYEALGGPLTSFTWQQSWARFPSCATIQTFLESPAETLVYGNFTGIAEACKFSQTLRYEQKTGFYRISIETKGISRNAKCHIKKIQEGYDLAVRFVSNLKKELDDLTRFRFNYDFLPKTESMFLNVR